MGAESRAEPESGIRGRFRAYVKDEAKAIALRQLAEGGPQALSINAIAKEQGMSGPALYRYFAGRDALLTELVTDGYLDLAAAVTEATHPGRGLNPPDRLRAFATAYRAWAKAQPHRYRLLFAAPFPGDGAHAEELVAASRRSMAILLDVTAGLTGDEAPPPDVGTGLDEWARGQGAGGVAPAVALRALVAWSRLHGMISLEIEGDYESMGVDPGLLFEQEVDALLRTPVTGPA